MSNMFKETGCNYFQFPQYVVRDGFLKEMTESELKLYLSLLHELQRRSTNDLCYTNAELSAMCGLSTGSLKSGRDLLVGRGLIEAKRGRGGVYNYAVTMPEQEGKAKHVGTRQFRSKKTLWELSRSE